MYDDGYLVALYIIVKMRKSLQVNLKIYVPFNNNIRR